MIGVPEPGKRFDLPPWFLPAFLAGLTLCLFGDSLLVPGRVPTGMGDMRSQYLYWRQFAFTEIRHGHFPLWNPHSFFGTPFFADPQSGLLYPPNWLHLFLSPERAASILIAIHFFLAGYFTGIWSRKQGSSVPGATIAATIYACCGPIITNIAAGHLPLLCSAAWAPLLFCAVEQLFSVDAKTARRWLPVGIGAVFMLAVDGYPQFACYTAIASCIYFLLLLPKSAKPIRSMVFFGGMFAIGWCMAGAQILAGAQFASESIRAAGLSFTEASAFSLPPENFLTALVPGLFGDGRDQPYFGRWFWWETCLFVGPTAAALILWGFSKSRRAISAIVMCGLMFVLALGAYTPLFSLLYQYLPGVHDFRATARFALLGILFLSILSAAGWDRLQEQGGRRSHARLAIIVIFAGAFGVASLWVHLRGLDWVLHAMESSGQSFELVGRISPATAGKAAAFATSQFLIASLLSFITAGLIHTIRRKTSSMLLFLLLLGNIFWFAIPQRATSDAYAAPRKSWQVAIQSMPPDQRVFIASAFYAEAGAANHFLDINGYNPLILNRTARYLSAVESRSSVSVGQTDAEHIRTRLLTMLRCAWVMPKTPGVASIALANPLPRFLLFGDCRVVEQSATALSAVINRSFDPARQVILETAPIVAPSSGDGTVHLIHETTDEMELEIQTTTPQILLITDAYSSGWHARPVDPNDHRTYEVLPADYCLRAIPLSAGTHRIRLEYRPREVIIGAWLSLAGIAAYLSLLLFGAKR